LVSDAEAIREKPFPECCPVYDCEEGTDVVYEVKAKPGKDGEEAEKSS